MPYYSYEYHRDTCAHCGYRLTDRQELWCGERCRQAARSAAKRPWRRVACDLCTNGFNTQDSRKTRCTMGVDTTPGEKCWELQNAEYQAKAEAIDTRDFPACAHCGEEAEYAGTGRHRKYCSDKCRVYAHRARKGRKSTRSVPASA